MFRKKYLKWALLSGVCLASTAWGATITVENTLQEALTKFQTGAYAQALDVLDHAPKKFRSDLSIRYWSGQCLHKLQKFESAAKILQKVVTDDREGKFQDAPYLLGQALYSTQEFRSARTAFERSVQYGYMKSASLYYIGYISNVLNEEVKAVQTFQQVCELQDSEMKQPALFQLAEMSFEKANETKDPVQKRTRFKNEVIPAYEQVIAFKSDDPLANQSRERIAEANQKIGEAIPRTRSGAAKPVQTWMIRLKENIKWDSNIINEADGKLVKVENKSSPLETTNVFGKFELEHHEHWILTPELGASATYTSRRSTPGVYANDNASVSPAVRMRVDHKYDEKPAATLIEFEFSESWRDYNSLKRLEHYSSSSNLILGERAEVLPIGSTTLKANIKGSFNHDDAQTYAAPAINLAQAWKVTPSQVLNFSVTAESQTARSERYDQKSLSTSVSHSLPNVYWGVSVDSTLGFTLTDTMNQEASRGIEKNLSPSLTLTKYLDQDQSHWSLSLNYTFTRNWSKDKSSYEYSKHVIDFGVQYTF